MDEQKEVISLDMRDHLYTLVAKRMDKALDYYVESEYDKSFLEANSIKLIISSEMNEDDKSFFDSASKKIRSLIKKVSKKHINEVERREKNKLIEKLPFYIGLYLEMIFKEMAKQGIWFPKTKKHDSFSNMLMQETFGISTDIVDKHRKELSEIKKEDLLNFFSDKMVEDVYAKYYIKNVL